MIHHPKEKLPRRRTHTHRTCRTRTRRFCRPHCTRHTHPCLPIAISTWRHRSIRLTDAIQHLSGRFLTKKKFAAASLTKKQTWHATILVLDPPLSDGCCFWLLPSQSPSHHQHCSVIAVRKRKNTWRCCWRQRQSHASFLVVRTLSPSYTPNK